MKKLLLVSITLMCLFTFVSCGVLYKENVWFSDSTLKECIVPELPSLDNKKYVNKNDEDIYVSLQNKEYDAYINEIFEYLSAQDYKYFGTQGEQKNTLAGAFTTYYFKPAAELSEFMIGDSYKFVFSDGSTDENGDVEFCILTIYRYEIQRLEYNNDIFVYNTVISLRKNSDAALSGFYVLGVDTHVHTFNWHHDEYGHWREYTCECNSTSSIEDHVDEYLEGTCSVCGREEEYVFELNKEGTGYILHSIGPLFEGGDVVIPSEHKGLPVVELGMWAMASNTMTSCVIPDSVKVIGFDCFQESENLESVIIGNGVTEIKQGAFKSCYNLKTVVIGDAVEYIRGNCFRYCYALESVTMGKNVKVISNLAFIYCTNLKTITIPATIEEIGWSVFAHSGFTDIYFEVSAPGENWHEEWNDDLDDVNIHWAEK